MLNVSVLSHIYGKESISNIGYNFGYLGIYLYTILCSQRRHYTIVYGGALIAMILLKASTGRIFQTIAFIGTILGLMYVNLFNRASISQRKLNKYYILGGAVLMILAISFYLFRYMGNIIYVQGDIVLEDFFLEMFGNISLYIFDKGNVANIVLLPKIIDSWGTEIGCLYGRSLFSSLNQIFPIFDNIFPNTQILVKTTWYQSLSGGNLPPTFIGELIANFGVFGVPFGMSFLGFLCGCLYNKIRKHDTVLNRLLYFQILISFIFILPKGDFSNFPLYSIFFTIILYKVITSLKLQN